MASRGDVSTDQLTCKPIHMMHLRALFPLHQETQPLQSFCPVTVLPSHKTTYDSALAVCCHRCSLEMGVHSQHSTSAAAKSFVGVMLAFE